MAKNQAMKEARIGKGDYNPTVKLCISICRVLGLTLNELFWDEE